MSACVVSVGWLFAACQVLWPLPLETCILGPGERRHPKGHPLLTLKRLYPRILGRYLALAIRRYTDILPLMPQRRHVVQSSPVLSLIKS